MKIIEKIGKCIEAILSEEDDPNYKKGILFEKCIINLFDKKYFAIHDWTRDISGKHDGYIIESDANPDLVMRYKPRDEQIAIECKFRSSLYRGKLNWTTSEKLHGYRRYMEKNIITFVVIGLGGTPDNPDRMFCIPLKDAKYPGLYPSIFEKFERPPDRNFFWDGKKLK